MLAWGDSEETTKGAEGRAREGGHFYFIVWPFLFYFMSILNVLIKLCVCWTTAIAGVKRTLRPIVTGTSVLGIKYADGVMIAADTLCSYGSLARFKGISRMKSVGEQTLIAAGGEYSDFQSIVEYLEEMQQHDKNMDDGFVRGPGEIHTYLRSVSCFFVCVFFFCLTLLSISTILPN